MKKFAIACSLFLLAFMPPKKTKVIFFGDSITEVAVRPGGYIPCIDSLCRKEGRGDDFEWVGAGISGNKVYDLYLRLEEDVLAKEPDLVLIYIGVNDVWHKMRAGTGTDPDKFEKFYQAIINKIRQKNIRVILCTPAAIGEKTDFSNQQDGDLNAYSTIIRKLAEKNQLPLVDLRARLLDYNKQHNPENRDRGILTTDGVHLNPLGNLKAAEWMWAVIRQ